MKLLNFETVVNSTPQSVSNASSVRLFASAQSVLTVAYSNGVAYANTTLPAASVTFLTKAPTDIISATVNVAAVSVAAGIVQ